jgi:hypothetical protein
MDGKRAWREHDPKELKRQNSFVSIRGTDGLLINPFACGSCCTLCHFEPDCAVVRAFNSHRFTRNVLAIRTPSVERAAAENGGWFALH